MKRWVAVAAVIAVAVVGLRAGLTRANGSPEQPRSFIGVLAQVRKSFGDNRLVGATVDGSTLHVTVTRAGDGGAQRSRFEAQVLAAAVADWMGSHGQAPIERFNVEGLGYGSRELEAVPTMPTGPSLRLDTCKSAARASIHEVWSNAKVTSVKWLPYLHGMCFFRLRNVSGYSAAAVPQAGLDTYLHIARKIFDPNQKWYDTYRASFEVDDTQGTPLIAIGGLPGGHPLTWVRRDLPSPFVGVSYAGVTGCPVAPVVAWKCVG